MEYDIFGHCLKHLKERKTGFFLNAPSEAWRLRGYIVDYVLGLKAKELKGICFSEFDEEWEVVIK